MLVFLLKSWQFLVGALIAAILSYGIHSLLMWRAKSSFSSSLELQSKTIKAECENAQKTTQEASHDYQNQLIALRDQLDSAKRVRPRACIPVHTADAPSGHNDAAPVGELSGQDAGVDTYDLLYFAADAEQVGRQLDACQGFIKAERK